MRVFVGTVCEKRVVSRNVDIESYTDYARSETHFLRRSYASGDPVFAGGKWNYKRIRGIVIILLISYTVRQQAANGSRSTR